MAYLDQVRYQVRVFVEVSDVLFQNVVKAGDLKPKGVVYRVVGGRTANACGTDRSAQRRRIAPFQTRRKVVWGSSYRENTFFEVI